MREARDKLKRVGKAAEADGTMPKYSHLWWAAQNAIEAMSAALKEDQGESPVGGKESQEISGEGTAAGSRQTPAAPLGSDGGRQPDEPADPAPTASTRCPNPDCVDGFLYGPVDPYGFRAKIGDCPTCNPTASKEGATWQASQARDAYGYLSRMFKAAAPQCEPLPDLMGLCTQIDNLIAGLRSQARDGWRPIEEIPIGLKDGRYVFLLSKDRYSKDKPEHRAHVGWWGQEDRREWCGPYLTSHHEVTHYMEVPTPPEPQKEEGR